MNEFADQRKVIRRIHVWRVCSSQVMHREERAGRVDEQVPEHHRERPRPPDRGLGAAPTPVLPQCRYGGEHDQGRDRPENEQQRCPDCPGRNVGRDLHAVSDGQAQCEVFGDVCRSTVKQSDPQHSGKRDADGDIRTEDRDLWKRGVVGREHDNREYRQDRSRQPSGGRDSAHPWKHARPLASEHQPEDC